MHKLIAPHLKRVDHWNGNKLDNRRTNLREATRGQNMWNRKLDHDNKTGFKGISFRKDKAQWQARIVVERKIHFLGYFEAPRDAAKAYDVAARQYFGKFARLNFPRRSEMGVNDDD